MHSLENGCGERGVMNFQIKFGKCFQAKEEMFNHIFLQRRLNAGFQHNF